MQSFELGCVKEFGSECYKEVSVQVAMDVMLISEVKSLPYHCFACIKKLWSKELLFLWFLPL